MKKHFSILSMLFTSVLLAQTPCENGMAGQYPCNEIDLLDHISLSEMNANEGNSGWGWTDPDTGKEYALMGLDNGIGFIDISNPTNAVYLGKLPTQTGNSSWRDVRVYKNHAFVVSDINTGSHGMQIFDLTRLRNATNPPVTFTNDAHYSGFGNCHTIVIDEERGYAYGVGSNTYSGGPHIVNIQDPLNPVFAGGYADLGYTHEATLITYSGPDPDHQGKEIYIGSNEYQMVVLDVTDVTDIKLISTLTYNNVAYTHQGWFTEDHRYFILNDEIDEIDFGFNTRTLVFDFSDLDNPTHKFDYYGPTAAIDHNGYVVGNKFYMANYTAGVRILDISDIANNNIHEIAYFDTYPEDNATRFNGVWNVYPFFESGNIMLTDIDRGFFLVREKNLMSVEDVTLETFTVSPNPSQDFITLKSNNANKLGGIQIFNVLGQKVLDLKTIGTSTRTLDVSTFRSGMYMILIDGKSAAKFIKK